MDERPGNKEDPSETRRDPLLEGADVPEETPTEDVVPDDVGSEKRTPAGEDPEEPVP